MPTISFARHRFPPDIIRHAVWLYARFTLSYRDVEDLLRVATRLLLKYKIRTRSLADQGAIEDVLAVEDDVVPFDRADMTQQVGVEREVRRGGNP